MLAVGMLLCGVAAGQELTDDPNTNLILKTIKDTKTDLKEDIADVKIDLKDIKDDLDAVESTIDRAEGSFSVLKWIMIFIIAPTLVFIVGRIIIDWWKTRHTNELVEKLADELDKRLAEKKS